MGFAERILSAPSETKVIIASNFMGLLLQTVGFFTFYWLKLDNVGRQGLWYYCIDSSFYECCATIDSYTSNTNSTMPAFVSATRAFETMGFIWAVVANIILYATIAKPSLVEKRIFRIFLKIVHVFAGINILVGVIIYGADFKNHDFTSRYNLHASYGLCVVASFMFTVSSLILIFADSDDS